MLRRMWHLSYLALIALIVTGESARAADWVRAGVNTNQPIWGIRGGLQWAVAPGGFRGRDGGPRGLIRIGYPALTNGGYDLINFIAVEPIVRGWRGLSELEHSKLDSTQGKRFRALGGTNASEPALAPGKLSKLGSGAEQLDITIDVEPFDNGAKVQVIASQRSDAPDEITLTVHALPGSAPLEYCILTATMGNKVRTRQLWLKDEVVSSLKLYPDHKGNDFAPHWFFSLNKLTRTSDNGVMVAITTDEENGASVYPFPGTKRWYYGGFKVTQYWKKKPGTFRDDLQTVVNARCTYWQTSQPIPGGVAYENFELQERFYQDQQFIFGITRKTPEQLGMWGVDYRSTAED